VVLRSVRAWSLFSFGGWEVGHRIIFWIVYDDCDNDVFCRESRVTR
jgi:hypothetical protein